MPYFYSSWAIMVGLVCDLPLLHGVLVALPGPVLLLVVLTGQDINQFWILKTNLIIND